MKRIFLSAFGILTACTLFAQANAGPVNNNTMNSSTTVVETPSNPSELPIQAEFKYSKETFQEAKQANSIVLHLFDLPDGPALDAFDKTLHFYVDSFTMTVGRYQSSGDRECVVTFKNNKVDFSVLNRLFVSNGISEVTFGGEKMKASDFFANY